MCFKPINQRCENLQTKKYSIFNQLSLHAVHNTTNNTSSTYKKTDTITPPRPSASSGFKIIGECDRPTSHGDAQSPQHGDAIFNVKITLSLFYNYLFHAQLMREHADKRCVF
jgi:hypothetical protein